MRTRLHPLAALLLLSGCTAAKSGIHLTEAEAALRRAEEFEAQELAQYEYTMAQRYLEKAREEAGYTEFRVAEQLARKSAQWSDQAIIFIERGGRAIDPDDLTSVPDEQAAPAPDPLLEPQAGALPPAPAPEPAPPPEPEPGDEFEVEEEEFDWEKQ